MDGIDKSKKNITVCKKSRNIMGFYKPTETKKTRMNKRVGMFALIFLVMLTTSVTAQTRPNRLEIGFNISEFQNDYGIGIHLISPYFTNANLAIKAGANFQWLENFDGAMITWTSYQNFRLGLRVREDVVADKIFIYGEGGFITILPNSAFSTRRTEFGGYGLFGFEFRPQPRFAYFIELGGVGTNATADRLFGSPIYSNGFLTNVGFRVGF